MTKYTPDSHQKTTSYWFVLDSKKPWRKIKVVSGIAFSGKKICYLKWQDSYGIVHTNIIGQTAFPRIEGAIANQNFRCHTFLMGKQYHFTVNARNACQDRLHKNIQQMRKNYGCK